MLTEEPAGCEISLKCQQPVAMATRGDDIGIGGRGNQTNTTRWNNAVLMLAQRLRRWANIKTALCRRAVSDGKLELSEAFWR